MEHDFRGLLWHSEVRGSAETGYVRLHIFIDPETGEMRSEMEYAAALGLGWTTMPVVA